MPHEQFVGADVQHHAEQWRSDQHVCADQYADEHVRAGQYADEHADQHAGASKFDVGFLVLHAVGPGQFDEHDEHDELGETHHDVPGEAAPDHVGDGDRHRRRREADDDAAADSGARHDDDAAAARRAERRARAAARRRSAWSGRAAW